VTVIDMSHYQNDADAIDWNRVRPGLAGLYLKITERSDYADPAWARNYASSVNIPRGAKVGWRRGISPRGSHRSGRSR
jgi:GH25 family lysozyme M1 (1,4-beta-N-acetylmuramidase)